MKSILLLTALLTATNALTDRELLDVSFILCIFFYIKREKIIIFSLLLSSRPVLVSPTVTHVTQRNTVIRALMENVMHFYPFMVALKDQVALVQLSLQLTQLLLLTEYIIINVIVYYFCKFYSLLFLMVIIY